MVEDVEGVEEVEAEVELVVVTSSDSVPLRVSSVFSGSNDVVESVLATVFSFVVDVTTLFFNVTSSTYVVV